MLFHDTISSIGLSITGIMLSYGSHISIEKRTKKIHCRYGTLRSIFLTIAHSRPAALSFYLELYWLDGMERWAAWDTRSTIKSNTKKSRSRVCSGRHTGRESQGSYFLLFFIHQLMSPEIRPQSQQDSSVKKKTYKIRNPAGSIFSFQPLSCSGQSISLFLFYMGRNKENAGKEGKRLLRVPYSFINYMTHEQTENMGPNKEPHPPSVLILLHGLLLMGPTAFRL